MNCFHLDYRPIDYFFGELQTRLRQSTSSLLRDRIAEWDRDVHGERALAVVAKVEMLNRIADRLNGDIAKLNEHLNEMPEAVAQCIRERRALNLPDRDLLWQLSVDTDAFLFEARSAYELIGKFLRDFFHLIFRRKVTEEQVIKAVTELGGDVSWVSLLKKIRDLFAHDAAPWLAVERTQSDPPQFDVLLLKHNAEDLSPTDFVHFRDCRAIQRGFGIAVNKIALWIVNEIAAIEYEESFQTSLPPPELEN